VLSFYLLTVSQLSLAHNTLSHHPLCKMTFRIISTKILWLLTNKPQLKSDYAKNKTVEVHNTAANNAAKVAGTICDFTWSIKSQPVVIELKIVVSEIGEH
jgi:hypothetical protein